MNPFGSPIDLQAWSSIGIALLIGTLAGAQREGAHRDEPTEERRAGLRDFLLVAALGSICGLLQNPVLTACAFLGMVAFWFAFKLHQPTEVGLTTDLAALVVFCLSFLAAVPTYASGAQLSIALTIVLTVVLESKRGLHKFFRETITEVEFNDTIRFLALIFVIYPLLPQGEFGPFGFFSPRRVWFFVILVSSISYVGYFLNKFLGADLGLKLTGLLGGLASTTAATNAFAINARQDPDLIRPLWQASVIANAVQFPRVLLLLVTISQSLVMMAFYPLLIMSGVGIGMALLIRPSADEKGSSFNAIKMRNPLSLKPAIHFGITLAAIILLVKAASAHFGNQALLWTASLGGLLDVDSIAISVGDLFNSGKASGSLAVAAVLLALLANAIFKTALAWINGSLAFAWRVGVAFLVMLGAGGISLLFF